MTAIVNRDRRGRNEKHSRKPRENDNFVDELAQQEEKLHFYTRAINRESGVLRMIHLRGTVTRNTDRCNRVKYSTWIIDHV